MENVEGVLTRKCIDCPVEFSITPDQKTFFLTHAMKLPKRCKECRAKRRVQQQTEGMEAPMSLRLREVSVAVYNKEYAGKEDELSKILAEFSEEIRVRESRKEKREHARKQAVAKTSESASDPGKS